MSAEEPKPGAIATVKASLPTEIGTTAAAAETQAMIQSRFTMAAHRPRKLEQVRSDILNECSRPNFVAETEEGKGNSALYRKPVGGGKSVEGLGIRFVEMALQCMGNNMMDSFTVQESDTERVIHIFALDLEKNTSWGRTLTLAKTVERKSLKPGEIPIRTRVNSQQQPVYVLPSDEGSFATKEAAEISKTSRTLGLRLIPGDIQDEAITKILETRLKGVTEAPDSAMRRVIDGMALQKVSVVMLEEYLGQPITQITPAQIVKLQGLYASLRDGETSWKEIMASAEEEKSQERELKTPPATVVTDKGVEATKAAILAEEAKQAAGTPAPPPSTEPIEVCGSCGATGVPLVNVEGVPLCDNCKPAPQPVATQPAAPVTPAATAGAAPPWSKAPTQAAPAAQPTPQVVTPQASAAPIWARPAQAAPQQPAQATGLSLEAQVEEIAKPSKPRVKPAKADLKGIKMPEFVDRISDQDGWTPDQYQKALAAIKRIPNANPDTEGLLASTVLGWAGLPVEQVNAETLETVTKAILELFVPKA